MKRIPGILLIPLLMELGHIAAFGNESPLRRSDSLLTLSEAVKYAIDSSITMRSGRNTVLSSRIDRLSTINALYPTAQSSISAGREITSSGSSSAKASVGAGYDFSLSQFALCNEGDRRMAASEYALEQKKDDLAVNVILQFARIICAAELIDVKEKDVAYQVHKLEEINAMFERGARSRADILLQKSTIAEAQLQVLDAHQELQRSKLTLFNMLGMPLLDRYRIDSTEVIRLKKRFMDDSTENYFANLPEKDAITAQRYTIAAEKARVQSFRFAYIPTLGISADWSAGKQFSEAPGSSHDIATTLQVGASLQIPLFDNKRRWLQLKNAELILDNAKLKLEELQEAADLAVQQDALEDIMAKDRITTNSTRLTAAQEALQAMEERYAVGASTLSDLNTVRTNFIEAQSALVQSQYDRTISRITLLHETGRTDLIYQLLDIGLLERGHR